MAEILLIGSLFIIAGGFTILAIDIYFGAYFHRWLHLRRGHEPDYMGRWSGEDHWRCDCGDWFSVWIGDQ